MMIKVTTKRDDAVIPMGVRKTLKMDVEASSLLMTVAIRVTTLEPLTIEH